MGISEKVAYLKGLAEGLKLDTESNEGKLFAAIIDVLEDMADEIADMQDEMVDIEDGLDAVSDDLSEVEESLYELDDEDEEEWDDEDDEDTTVRSIEDSAVKAALKEPEESIRLDELLGGEETDEPTRMFAADAPAKKRKRSRAEYRFDDED